MKALRKMCIGKREILELEDRNDNITLSNKQQIPEIME